MAGLSVLAAGSVAGCGMVESPGPKESDWNEMVEEFGWPPSVPKSPDQKGFRDWQQEIWLYTWMAAAHTEKINSKIEEQNQILEDIRDELKE